ncbi:hypothetical protein [Noviherbaspirillum sp.]|uniref:hypothetical protein n=1 Tax=Noviherbaspirillum sp. TaxID=1926288 RepID=UPI002FE37E0F
MAENNIEGYLRWITPKPVDPTYSVLKAHLLLEELLRAFLAKTLPHPEVLRGARLTFGQLLAVARSCCTSVSPDHWMWKAIADLNKLRNMLSHEVEPKDLAEKISEYADFVALQSKTPFPEPTLGKGENIPPNFDQPLFGLVDIATLGLYIQAAAKLGFDVDSFLGLETKRESEVAAKVHSGASLSS